VLKTVEEMGWGEVALLLQFYRVDLGGFRPLPKSATVTAIVTSIVFNIL